MSLKFVCAATIALVLETITSTLRFALRTKHLAGTMLFILVVIKNSQLMTFSQVAGNWILRAEH